MKSSGPVRLPSTKVLKQLDKTQRTINDYAKVSPTSYPSVAPGVLQPLRKS